jgi:hypothetical protein
LKAKCISIAALIAKLKQQRSTDSLKIIDKLGIIILVNTAWRLAANRNPPLHKDGFICEGANYLEILDQVKGDEEKNAKIMASNIR